MKSIYSGLIGLLIGAQALGGPLEDFVDVFQKEQVPHVRLEQRASDIEKMLSFEGKTITEKLNAEYIQLQQSFFNNAAKKGMIGMTSLAHWQTPLVEKDAEGALLIYQAGDDDFIVMSPLEFEALYTSSITDLVKGKGDDLDVKHTKRFLNSWMGPMKKGHKDYMLGVLSGMRNGSASKEQVDQFQDICDMKLKGEAVFVPGMNGFSGNGKQYTLVGSIHNHNGTGSESGPDLTESMRSPVIVAEYKPDTSVDMHILEGGKKTNVIEGLHPLPFSVQADLTRLDPVGFSNASITIENGNTNFDLRFSSKQDMKYVTLSGNGSTDTYRVNGKELHFQKRVPYVVELVVATNNVGNSVFLDVEK